MKVLHVFKTYLPETVGGIEQVIYQMCQATLQYGVQSQVLTLSGNQDFADGWLDGHYVVRCKRDVELSSTGFSFAAIAQLRQLAREVDLIHYHFPWPFMDFMHAAANITTPYVVSYHSDIVKQKFLLKLYRPLMMHFLRRAQKIIVASPNYLDSSPILRSLPQTIVVPYGIAPSGESGARTSECYWRQDVPGPFFLFLGVLRYYKGLHVLLQAMRAFDIPLVVAGSGPLEQELRAQATKLGLNNVHFLGRVSEKEKLALLEQCYALVLPSHLRSEAFGMTLLEAAMFAKPLISCEMGSGTSYINLPNVTGLVVPPSDPQALAEAMQELWSKPQLAAEMGTAARQRYEQVFSREQMGRRLFDLYDGVLNNLNTDGAYSY